MAQPDELSTSKYRMPMTECVFCNEDALKPKTVEDYNPVDSEENYKLKVYLCSNCGREVAGGRV